VKRVPEGEGDQEVKIDLRDTAVDGIKFE